jgi:hypothetical protein
MCGCVWVGFVMCGCLVCVYFESLRLPCLRFFRAFPSVVRQMPRYNYQRLGTAYTLPNLLFVFFVRYSWCFVVNCDVLCIACKCVLPPGANPIAVDKYIDINIISYNYVLKTQNIWTRATSAVMERGWKNYSSVYIRCLKLTTICIYILKLKVCSLFSLQDAVFLVSSINMFKMTVKT